MPKLKNINPLGQVDVPLLRRQGQPFGVEGVGCLEPGEVFEVGADVAKRLLEQADNYQLVKAPAKRAAKKAPTKKATVKPTKPTSTKD